MIIDYYLNSTTGINLSIDIRKINKDIPIFICTGSHDILYKEKKNIKYINGIINKPIHKDEFISIISNNIGDINEYK